MAFTPDQITTLQGLYGNSVDPNAMSSMTPAGMASSYLGMSGQNNDMSATMNNNQTNDPIRDSLIQQGYLQWGSDAQGNPALTGGANLQSADADLMKTANTTQGGNTAWGMPSSGFVGASPVLETPTQNNRLSQMFAMAGPETKTFGLQGSIGDTGTTDQATGAHLYDYSQATPKITQNSAFDQLLEQVGPAIATMAIGGPLFEALGGPGAALFKGAGQALTGGGFNPMSLVNAGLGSLNLPPQVMQAIQMGANLAGGQKPSLAGLAPSAIQQLMHYLPNIGS